MSNPIADSRPPFKARKHVTLPQWCVLCDALSLGYTAVFSGDVIAARRLTEKGYGNTELRGTVRYFYINDAGRALLA